MLTFPSVGGECISLLTPVAKLPRLTAHIIDLGHKARRTVRSNYRPNCLLTNTPLVNILMKKIISLTICDSSHPDKIMFATVTKVNFAVR